MPVQDFDRVADIELVDVFLARQPVLDRELRTWGYELLYRSSPVNSFPGTDGTLASLEVINASFFASDIGRVAGGKRAFVNFTRELLLSDAPYVLSPEEVVIEVLEGTSLDDDLRTACLKLRERGYLLAADDVVSASEQRLLLELTDLIKVDFRATSPAEQAKIVATYGRRHSCLAEKVETQAEFEAARKCGYQYFQGYFFAQPTVVKGKQIPGYKMNYLRILDAVHRPEVEFNEIERLIRQELSVAYKLLRYANSALFAQRTHIDSIKRALVILGEQELRKWVSVVLLLHLASDKPDALVMCALIRAHFCEALAQLCGAGGRKSELFLMGLFSLLDAITDSPLNDALRQIRVAPDIQATLLGEPPPHFPAAPIFDLVRVYERGDWLQVLSIGARLRLESSEIREAYLRAVEWCDQVFSLLPQFEGNESSPAVQQPVPVR